MSSHINASPETCVWGCFDATLPPVVTVKSGDTVVIDTISGAPECLPEADAGFTILPEHLDVHARSKPLAVGHILTGPVAVEGAKPGHVLEVQIMDVKLRQDWGWNIIRPLVGTLPDDFDTTHLTIIPLDADKMTAQMPWGLELPLNPFFGVMGVAPPPNWGRISTIEPRMHGGNIDNKELVAGTTLFLPVWAEGALFSCGDGHGAQGDGEVCVTAIETALQGTFRLVLRDDLSLAAPRAQTPTHLITMGLHRDLDRCAEMALRDMIVWITARTGLSREEAYMLCSLAGDLRITQTVNGNKGVHMMMETALLDGPARDETAKHDEAARDRPKEQPFADIAKRIRWHRTVTGLSQEDYARKAKIGRTQLANWETGSQRIGVDGAIALWRTFGLSLDFMYEGIDDALPMSLRLAWRDRVC